MSTTAASETAAESFVIEGGRPLSGRVRVAGQQERRAADPRGLPADRRAGRARATSRASATSTRCSRCSPTSASRPSGRATNEVRVHAADDRHAPRSTRSSRERIRGSFLLAGPLLARCGHVLLSPPGGDFIGRRPLDTARPRLPARSAPRSTVGAPLRDARGAAARHARSSSTRRA